MRSKKTPHRTITPDAKYGSTLIAKLINGCMQAGRKATATVLVYDALAIIKEKSTTNEMTYLDEALENVKPQMEVRSRRVGGANYQVPREVRPERRQALAFRWIIDAARAGKGKPMADRLANELMNAFNNEGVAIKKRDDTHKMAQANKAFAHYAW